MKLIFIKENFQLINNDDTTTALLVSLFAYFLYLINK